MTITLTFGLMVPALAAGGTQASSSKVKLTVDGKATEIQQYIINGDKYFKLRDLAMLLNNTTLQFNVEFEASAKTMYLTTGASYTPVGGELSSGAQIAASNVSSWKLVVDGTAAECKQSSELDQISPQSIPVFGEGFATKYTSGEVSL